MDFMNDNEMDYELWSDETSLAKNSSEWESEVSSVNDPDYLDYRKLPLILNGKFFKIVKLEWGKVTAQCNLCLPTKTLVKGSLKSTTNFLKHLKSKHGEAIHEYEIHKSNKFPFKRSENPKDFESNLLRFFISSRIPLKVIERQSFIDLIKHTGYNKKLFDKKTLKEKINKMYEEDAKSWLATYKKRTSKGNSK